MHTNDPPQYKPLKKAVTMSLQFDHENILLDRECHLLAQEQQKKKKDKNMTNISFNAK